MNLVRWLGILLMGSLMICPAPSFAQGDQITCDDVTTALWLMAEIKGYSQLDSEILGSLDTVRYDQGVFAPVFDLVAAQVHPELRVNDAAINALEGSLSSLAPEQVAALFPPTVEIPGEDPACKSLRDHVMFFLMADALIDVMSSNPAQVPGAAGPDLPDAARRALDERIKTDFGEEVYTITRIESLADGAQLCVVIDPPLVGSLAGQTLYYDYAVLQQEGSNWSAIMVEDHIGGVVLSIFGCEMVYKGD
jgi:hypothetical protein